MGVQGLSTQLRSFSCPFILNQKSNPQEEQRGQAHGFETSSQDFPETTCAIIDGPSLAYYVYYRCIAAHAGADGGIGNLPTYAKLGAAAIALLDKLAKFGFKIDTIYFDGLLPETKASTRHERLHKNLLLRKAFHSSHVNLSQTTFLHLKTSSEDAQNTFTSSFTQNGATGRLSRLPSLPFLVSSIIEALQDSQKYAPVTKTVPGEADVFCKIRSHQLRHRAILTNDSDLVLLHPHCKVIILNDIEFVASGPTLRGIYYLPCTISKQLECSNLVKLGHKMVTYPGMTLRACAARLKESDTSDEDESFRAFAQAYSLDYRPRLSINPMPNRLCYFLDRLDPRISEYVLGCLCESSDGGGLARMYLPPLVDDPTRASAWRISRPIRVFAYSLLVAKGKRHSTKTAEVDRRGERIVEDEIQAYNVNATNEALENTANSLDEMINDRESGFSAWRRYALIRLLELLQSEGSRLPNLEDIRTLFSDTPGDLSWAILHLHAQLDGMLYSLRILRQVLQVHLAIDDRDSTIADLEMPVGRSENENQSCLDAAALNALNEKLKSMPMLQDLHTRPGEPFQNHGCVRSLSSLLLKFYPSTSFQSHETEDSQGSKNPKKKLKTKMTSDRVKEAPRNPTQGASRNVYSLLEDA